MLLVENAEARGLGLAAVELSSGAGRRFVAARLELGKHDGEFGAVADALFNNRKNGDAGKIGEEMFEFYDAGFEFAVAGGFGQFFEFKGLIERKFTDRVAGDFGEMRAHSELFSHFVGEGADVGAGGTFDDEAGDGACNFEKAEFKDFHVDGF